MRRLCFSACTKKPFHHNNNNNNTVDFFHFVGVNDSSSEALYMNISSCILFSGICFSTNGLSPSGPGDFLLLNILKTSLNRDESIQSNLTP